MNTQVALTSAQKLAIGDAVRTRALSYARKTGTAIDTIVIAAANAKHEFSLTPIKLMRAIKENLSEEDVEGLPLPGSKWSDKLADGTYINNPDIAEWKDPSKPDGKAKEISFYVVWADGTPEGQHVVTELDYIKCASTEGMKTDHIPADWLKKYNNPQSLKKRKKYLEGRRATVRKAYKDAIRLLWQLDMVNELSGVAAEIAEDMDDNTVLVVNTASKSKATGIPTEWKYYSVGAFLKLDPIKASETDGSYAALEATAKREKSSDNGKGTKPGELKLNAVHTPESSDKVATVWHSYLYEALNDRKGDKYSALVKHLSSDSGRQALVTMFDIHGLIGGLRKMDQLETIYQAEKEKMNKAAA